MEYVNLAAIVWLTFYTLSTAYLVNHSIGHRIARVNMFPLVLSITSLTTLGISIIGDLIP